MRGSIWGGLALVAAALAMPVLGQTGGDQTASSGAAPYHRQPQHYTAELKMTTVRTLANGTTITLESNLVLAADSHGRTMSSNTDLWNLLDGKPITRVIVSDPVAGTRTTWTSPGTTATVTTLEPPHRAGQSDCYVFFTTPTDSTLDEPKDPETAEPSRGVVGKPVGIALKSSSDPAAMSAEMTKPVFTTVVEDLGSATIQGIKAHGKRITRTTPVGATGNDVPLVNTEENWISMGTNPKSLLLRRVSDDPQFGKSTTELANLNLEEPDLSTFQPPDGYEIVTQEMHSVPCPKALKTPEQ